MNLGECEGLTWEEIEERFGHADYEVLLAHLFSKDVTEASIAHHRQGLQEALSYGTWLLRLQQPRYFLSLLGEPLQQVIDFLW